MDNYEKADSVSVAPFNAHTFHTGLFYSDSDTDLGPLLERK